MLAILAGAAVALASPRTIILVYHDIIPKRDSKSVWFDCTQAEFAGQMKWLKSQGANFVTLDQVVANIRTKSPLPPRSVAITFADNYRGMLTFAWPTIKAMRIPVASFVHTDYVGSKVGRPKLSWSELRDLRDSGLLSVQSQTESHPADLRTLTDSQLAREFSGSRSAIRQNLGYTPPYIAYPNGKFDRRVEAVGLRYYQAGFTEEQRPAQTAPRVTAIPRYVHTKYRTAFAEGR